jgi:hypothetical protein
MQVSAHIPPKTSKNLINPVFIKGAIAFFLSEGSGSPVYYAHFIFILPPRGMPPELNTSFLLQNCFGFVNPPDQLI